MIDPATKTRAGKFRAMALLCTTMVPTASFAAGAPATAQLLGPTAAEQPVTLSLFLPSRDPQGAKDFVAHVSDPNDPLYHHYLTPQEYAARFGADEANYNAVAAWAKSQGLSVGERYAGLTVLPVTGSAASLGKALGVSFSNFSDVKGRTFYTADAAPKMPEAIAAKVGGVVGLSSAAHFRPLSVRLPAGQKTLAGSGSGTGYTATDLRTIYQVPTLSFGAQTQTVALFEQGGFDPNDVTKYITRNKLPTVPVVARSVNGYGTAINDIGIEAEAVLDIDMAIAINPALKQVIVYEDGTDSFGVALVDSFAAMASDGVAKTISVSYGEQETYQDSGTIAAENTVLTQLAAQGQAVFVSSGDLGAYGQAPPGLNVLDPASQPMVTAVGGTQLFNGANDVWLIEQAWNELPLGLGATGGGVSTVWPLPSYQLLQGNPITTDNGGSATMRNVPDVAAVADPLTGVSIYSKLNGGWFVIGGTSASAPIWAGLYSLVGTASEAFGLGAPGFANPSLYQVKSYASIVGFPYHDTFVGTNGDADLYGVGGFSAGSGYDNTTGLGSFIGDEMVADLALSARSVLLNQNPPGIVKGLAVQTTPTTATLTWSPADGATGYILYVANYKTTGQSYFGTVLEKEPSGTLTGLSPNSSYYVYVFSVSPTGYQINTIVFTTPKASS